MKITEVTLKGTGQLNGTVPIFKTIEIDDNQAKHFVGSKREQVIIDILSIHYPGVKVDPKKIGVSVSTREVKKAKSEIFENSNTEIAIPKIKSPKIERKKPDRIKTSEIEEKNEIIEFEYPEDSKEIQSKLDGLILELKASKWEFGNNNNVEINNKRLDKILGKYELGVSKLRISESNGEIIKIYKDELASLKLKRFLNINGIILLLGGIIVFCTLLVYLFE